MNQPKSSTGSTEIPSGADPLGTATALLAAAVWATSAPLVKLLAIQTGVSALALAFWRDLAGSLFLFAALSVLRPSWLRVPRRELGWLLALGGSLGAFHVIWNL